MKYIKAIKIHYYPAYKKIVQNHLKSTRERFQLPKSNKINTRTTSFYFKICL